MSALSPSDLAQVYRLYYQQFSGQLQVLLANGVDPFPWGQFVNDLQEYGRIIAQVCSASTLYCNIQLTVLYHLLQACPSCAWS
jgi:hypothetical protein